MKIVAIVQARMTSSRLPGKVMMKLGEKITIDHVVSRLKQSKNINQLIVATSSNKEDDLLELWCKENEVLCFRGSENDVLDRYYMAASKYNADIIVRITADCPLIDPEIVDKVIDAFFKDEYDGFGLSGGFPDGLDCQVFTYLAIEKAWKEATLPSDREHVGSYIENTNPSAFKLGSIELLNGLESHRWTLDEKKDYIFLNSLLKQMHNIKNFRTQDVLNYLYKNPDLSHINSSIIRNEGYWSQRNDEENI